MAAQEISEIVQCLEDSRSDFRAAAEGTPESQANVRPAEDRWSVLECVEHIVVAETRFLGWLTSAPQAGAALPARPIDKAREAELLSGVSARARAVQGPEPVRPTGRFATLADALAHFDAARAASIEFAEKQGAALYSLATTHPFFGVCNGAEVMILIAAHARLHAAQIREIRSAL